MTKLVNRSGAEVAADAIDAFAAGLAGRAVRPGDADYDAARRIWNAAIDRRPGLIARRRSRRNASARRSVSSIAAILSDLRPHRKRRARARAARSASAPARRG